jgi:hypothetical protein
MMPSPTHDPTLGLGDPTPPSIPPDDGGGLEPEDECAETEIEELEYRVTVPEDAFT